MHTFTYSRVSTAGQTTKNQDLEIEQAGYVADQAYSDTISGKIPAGDRPEFAKMLDSIARTRKPKRLIVTKLDRLGRDAGDILSTVKLLEGMQCAVKVLQLGDIDLTSAGGKIVVGTLAALAEVERDILIERTHAGLARAKREGKTLGRPKVTTDKTRQLMLDQLRAGNSVSQVAREHGVSRATVIRVRSTT